jgi:molybdopterin-guanine dinucleotide biosynthesis protein A
MKPLLVGLLVGGRASRFGGVAKGLLPAPDTGEALAARLARLCREALPDCDVVLVGNAGRYAELRLTALADQPAGVGPLGGLAALFAEAERRHRAALAVAADLPHVTRELVARLSAWAPGASAVAPRPDGRWQPLFARYEPARCLPLALAALADGRLAARSVLESLGGDAAPLPLGDEEAPLLDDWDSPEDMKKPR